MKLVPTRRTDYAIQAMVFLAHRGDDFAAAVVIAEAMALDQGYLHQVLAGLQRAGLLSSRTGRSGGYALARSADDITIQDIVESTEGSLEGGECALRGGPCHWDQVCALHWVWSAARSAFAQELATASLADVAAIDRALVEERIDVPTTSHRS
jgi:Rrf2 family protein